MVFGKPLLKLLPRDPLRINEIVSIEHFEVLRQNEITAKYLRIF